MKRRNFHPAYGRKPAYSCCLRDALLATIVLIGTILANPAPVPAADDKPLALKFTAVDGSAVNLESLRGKVVLIDFWATWCPPCRTEFPHVLDAYRKLHTRGFEIIGISLDQSKDALTTYMREQGITWPQYFDGQGWNNSFAKQFNIHSIPAMWLVDKRGVVVDTNARADLAKRVEDLLNGAAPVAAPAPIAAPAAIPVAPSAASHANTPAVIKSPPPASAEQHANEQIIRGLFGKEYSDRTPSGKKALGAKLLGQGIATVNDASARFVCFCEARDLAAAGGDVQTANAAIDELDKGFVIDAVEMRVTAFLAAAPRVGAADSAAAVSVGLPVLDQAIAAENFVAVHKLLTAVHALALKSKEVPLLTAVHARTVEAAEFQRAATQARVSRDALKKTPDDAAANLAVGQYLGIVKGDWAASLPMLAKGSDAGMKALALQEVASRAAGKGQLQLADGWWDFAEKQAEPSKSRIRRHAGEWYEKAWPAAAEVERTRAEPRLAKDVLDRLKGTVATVPAPVPGGSSAAQPIPSTGGIVIEGKSLAPGTLILLGPDAPAQGQIQQSLAYTWDGKSPQAMPLFKRTSRLTGSVRSMAVAHDGRWFYNGNGLSIVMVSRDASEKVIFNHTTYVRHLAVDSQDNLYFSEASGSGSDGKIFRLTVAKDGAVGPAELVCTIRVAELMPKAWVGAFSFGSAPGGGFDAGAIFTGTGNYLPSEITQLTRSAAAPGQPAAGWSNPQRLFSDATRVDALMVTGPSEAYYAAGYKLFRLTNWKTSELIFNVPGMDQVSDITIVPGSFSLAYSPAAAGLGASAGAAEALAYLEKLGIDDLFKPRLADGKAVFEFGLTRPIPANEWPALRAALPSAYIVRFSAEGGAGENIAQVRKIFDPTGVTIWQDCAISAAGYAEMVQMKRLGTLLISNRTLSDAEIASIGEMTNLYHLDFSKCSFNDSGWAALTKLPKLTFLTSVNSTLGDSGLGQIARMEHLQTLYLWHNPRLTDQGLSALQSLSHLSLLVVSKGQFSQKTLDDLRGKIPSLRVQESTN